MQNKLYVGMVCKAKFSVNPDRTIFKDVWLPIRIVKEHKYWWDAEVLEHESPHPHFGPSKPYQMSINKHALKVGEIQIKDIHTKKKSA